MKKLQIGKVRRWMLLLLMLPLMAGEAWAENNRSVPTGAVNGLFSVSATKQVYFSKGNLQYIGSASTPYWKFAEHQWDIIASSAQVSTESNVDRDKFGWGTSGYNHGGICYQPWCNSTNDSDYRAYGLYNASLYEQSGKADWGYNRISNGGNQENQWRTPTANEWEYLVKTRNTNSGKRYALARLNNINGLLLLPDNWSVSIYNLTGANDISINYSANTISIETWNEILEPAGCVFLPAIDAPDASYAIGKYWSSVCSSDCAYCMFYAHGNNNMMPKNLLNRHNKYNIRVVQDYIPSSYSINVTINNPGGGTVSGAGEYAPGEIVTLFAQPNLRYEFVNWKEGNTIVSTEPTYSFTATYNRSLVASFKTCNYDFSAVCSTGQMLYYNIIDENNHKVELTKPGDYYWTGYIKPIGEIVLPSIVTYNNICYEVIQVGASAFYNCSDLSGSLEIPNTYTSVGKSAFYQCGFTGTLVLPNSISSIGENAFISSGFTGILSLPNSLTTIGSGAFAGCIGFNGNLTIPNLVTSIGDHAFSACHFEGLYVNSESGLSIGMNAFLNCNCLTFIELSSIAPPSINNFTFEGVSTTIPIYIPCRAMALYQSSTNWNKFTNFQEQFYLTLNVSSGNITMGNASIAQQPDCSTDAIVTATPNTGYIFANWTKDGNIVSTDVTFTFTVTENTTLVANFDVAPSSYTITASAKPAVGGTVSGANTYNHGTNVTLTATANEGYTFINWTENDVEVSTSPNYSFTATADRTLVANFSLNSYTISASANPAVGGTVSGANTYNHGANVTLTANANEGYTFVNWTENDMEVSTSPTYSFTATADRTLVANFSLNSYTISASANPAVGGTVSGAGEYNHGANVTLTATANEGYTFINWTENDVEVSTSPNYSFTATADRTLVANFSLNSYTISASANPAVGGTVSGANTYNHGANVTLTATANEGYTFINWTENDVEVSTSPNYSFTATADRTLVANFSLNSYTISASANPAVGGTVSGAGSYNHGANVTLAATANEGYTFVNWTENDVEISTSPNYSFTATADRTLVANFSLNSYTISASANPAVGGTVSGADTYSHGANVTLTATANEGYTFVNWTENDVEILTSPNYSFTATADRTLVANFVEMGGNHWIPEDSQFASYMNVLCVVNIDGVEQERTDLEIGAFCGEQCRGSKLAQQFPATGRYIFRLAVYGNSGDDITFRLYDHQLQTELDLQSQNTLVWENNGYGGLGNPYVLSFVSSVSISATVNPSDAGTVSGAGDYTPGTMATLTATPNEGFAFLNWTEDNAVVSTDASYSFTVETARTLVANFEYVQTLTLANGYNWISPYIEMNDSEGLAMLEQSLGSNGEVIQNRQGLNVFYYEGYGWWGDLEAITNEQMYQVKTTSACEVELVGNLASVNNHPITINEGWNWIGYPLNYEMNTVDALSSLTAETDDVIKNRLGFSAYYEGYGWYGDVETMEPGQGYMYKQNASTPQTLTYPTNGRNINMVHVPNGTKHYGTDAYAYSGNMSVVAVAEMGGEELRSEDYELAAFVNGQCRGSVRLLDVTHLNRSLALLTIQGEAGEKVSYRLYDHSAGLAYESLPMDEIEFAKDYVEGTMDNPVMIHFNTTGVEEFETASMDIYPNPTMRNHSISMNLSGILDTSHVIIEIYNAYGQKIREVSSTQSPVTIEGFDTPGMYFIKVITDSDNIICGKIIVE